MLGQITLHGILTCVIAVIIFIFQSLNYLVTELKKYVTRKEHGEKITSIVIADTTISSDLKPNNNNALENCIIAQDLIQKHFDIPLFVAENEPKVDDLIQKTQISITRKENSEFVDHLIDNSYIARGLGLIAATVGRETEFYLYSRYSNSFENIVVELKGRNGESGKLTISNRNSVSSIEPTSIPISYIYDEDRIKVTYIPFTEGVHTLTLVQNGLSICRSPYYVSVDISPTNSKTRIRLGAKKYRMAMKSDKENCRNIETKDKSINNITHTIESSKTTVKQDVLPVSKENCAGTDVMSIVTKFESKSSGVRKKIQKRMISITERSHEYDFKDGNSTSLDVKPEIETHENYDTNNVNINNENDKLNYKNIVDVNNYNKQNKSTIKHKENNEIINDIPQTENVLPSLPKCMSSVIVYGKENENSNIIGDYSQIFKVNEPLGQNFNEILIDSLKEKPEIYSTNSEQCTENENVLFDEDKKTEVLMENTKNPEPNTNDCTDEKNTDSTLYNINFAFESIITSITKPNRVCEKCSKVLLEILSELPRNINVIQHTNSNDNSPSIVNILEQPTKENNGFEHIIKNMNEYKNEYLDNDNSANSKSSITIIDTHIKCHSQNKIELSDYNSDELCNSMDNSKITEVIIKTNEYDDDKIILENIPNKITSTFIKQSSKVDKSECQEHSISTNTDPIYESANKIEQTKNLENPKNHNANIMKSKQCDENINTNLNHNCKERDLTLSMHNSSIINTIEKTNETLDTNELKLINKVLSSFNVPVTETIERKELYHESQINNICETDEQSIIVTSNQDVNQKLIIEKLIEPVLNSFKINMVEQIVQLYLNKDLSNQHNIQLLKNNYIKPFNELHEIPSNNYTNNAELKHENKNGENDINEIPTSLVDSSLNNVKHIITKSNTTQNDIGNICETEIYSNSKQYKILNCDKNIEQINCIQPIKLETSIINNTEEIAKDKQKDEKLEKINNVKIFTDKLEKILDIEKEDHVPASKIERMAETEKIIESNLEKKETKYKTPKPCESILVENIKVIELNTTYNTSKSNLSETDKVEESIKEEIETLQHFQKPDDAQTSTIELKTTSKSNVVNVSEISTINKPNVRGIETTTEIMEFENTALVKKPSIKINDSREIDTLNEVDLKTKTFTLISNDNEYITVAKNTTREKEILPEISKADGEKSVLDKVTELKLQPINLTDIVVKQKLTSEDIKTKPNKLLSNNPTIVNIEVQTTDTQSLSNTIVIVSIEQPNTIIIQNKSDVPVLSLKKNVLTTESKSKKVDIKKKTTNVQELGGQNIVMESTRLQDEHKCIGSEIAQEKILEDSLDLLIIKEPIKTKIDIKTIDTLSDDITSIKAIKEHAIDYDSTNVISAINGAHSDLLDKNSEIEHASEPNIHKCNFVTNEETIKVKTNMETEQSLSNYSPLKPVENVSENNIDTIHRNLVKNEAQSESLNANNKRKLEHISKSILDNSGFVNNHKSIKDKTVDSLSNDINLLAVVHISESDMENTQVELKITSKIIKINSFEESSNVTMLDETEDQLLKERNDNEIEIDLGAMHKTPLVPVENTSEVDIDQTHEVGTLIVCPSELLVKHNNQKESENESKVLEVHTDLVDTKEFIKAKIDIETIDSSSNNIQLEKIVYQIEKPIETNNDANFNICSRSNSKDKVIKTEKRSELNKNNIDLVNKNLFKDKSEAQHQLLTEESKLQDKKYDTHTIALLESIIKNSQSLCKKELINGNTDIIISVSPLTENDSTSAVAVKNSNETDTDNVQVELQPILEMIEGNRINESIIAKIITEKIDQILKEKIEKQSETDTDGIRTTDIVTVENTSEITIDTTGETQVTNSSQPDSKDGLPNTEIKSEQIITNTDLVTNKKPIIDNTNIASVMSVTNIPPFIPVEKNIEIDIDNIHKVGELSDCPSISQVKHYNQVESETQSEVLEGDTVHDDIEEPIRSNKDIGTEDLLTNKNDSTSVVAVNNSNETDTYNVQVELQPILEIIEGNSINESIIAKIITEKVDQILKEKIEKQSETHTDGIRTTDILTVENTSEITIDTTCETQVTNSSQPDSIDELPNTEITSEQIITNTDLVTNKKPINDNTNIPPLIPVENNIEIDIDNIHKVGELSDCPSESQVKHNNQVESETQSEVLEGDIVHDDIEEPIRSNTDIRTEDLLTNENDSTSVVAFNNSNETDTDNVQVELQPILEIIEGNNINESIIAKIITEKVDQILKEKIEKQSETDTDGIRTTDIVPVENKSEITIDTTGETQVTNSSHPDKIDELPNTGITSEQIITNTDLVTNKKPIIDKTTIVSVMPVTNIPPLIPVENNIEIDIDNIHKVGESSDCPSESQVKHYNQVESETQSEVLEGYIVHDDIEEPIRSNTDIRTEDLLTNENDSTSVVAFNNSNETDTDNVQVELQPILEIIEGNSINESIIAKIITEKVDQILKEKIEKQSETDTDGIRTTDIVTVENTSEITIDTTCETQVTNSSQPDSIDELPNTEITSEQIIANTDLVTNKKPIIDNTNIPPLIPVENNIEIDIDNIHKVGELSDCPSESQVKHYNQVESETQSEVLEGDIVHDDIEEPIRSNTDIRTEDLLTNENDSTSVVAFNNSNETNTDNIQVELQPILEIIEGNSINESIIAKIITEKVDQILKEKIEKQSETDTDGIRTTDIVPVENKSEITIDITGETQVTNSSHPDSIDELPNTGITSEQIITNTDLVTNKRPIIDKTTIVSVMPVTNIPPLIPVENNIEIDIDNIHKVGESSDCPSESQVKHYNQVESETQSEVLEGDTVHDDIEEPIRSNTDIGTEDLLTNENDSTSVVAVKNSNETDTDNVQVELQPILEIIEGNSINESIIAKIIIEKVDQILKEKIEKQSETDTDGIRTTDILTVENTSEITIDTTCETQVTNSSQPDSIDELPNTEITSEQIIANTDLVTNKKPIIDNTNIPPLIPVENNIEIDIDNIHKVGELSDCPSESQVKHYNQVESETQSEVLEGDIVHDDIEEPIRSNTDIRTEDLLTNENDSTSVVAFNNSNETNTDNIQVELQPILEIIEGNSINESIIAKIITEKVDQILKEKIEKQSETDTDGIRTTDIVPVENKSEITIDTTGETQVTNSSHPDSIDELPNTGITSEQIITNTDLVTNKRPIIDKTTIVSVMPVTNIPPLIPVENNIEIDIDNIHKVGESSDCPSESQVKHYNQVESETQSEVLEGDTVHDDIEEPIRSNTDIGTEDLLTNENDSTSVVAVKNSNETDTDNVQVELQPILEIIEGNSINESIIAKIIIEKVDQILKEKIEKQSETDTDGIRTTDILTVENTSEITIDTTCETQVTNSSQPDSIDELPNTEITSEQIIANTDLVTNKKPIIDNTNIPPLIPVENNIEIDIDNIHKVGELSDCPSESQVKHYNQVESETQSEVLEGDIVHDDIEEPIRSNTDIRTEDLLTNENDSTSVVAFNNSNETNTDNIQVELQPILEIIEGNSINESIIAKIITEKVDQILKEKIEKQSETDTDGIRTTDIVPVENKSEITIDTTGETQVTNSSHPDSIDELPNTGITSEQIITNTDLVTNKRPIIDKTTIVSVMPVTNIPPLIPVENNIEIDIDNIHKVGESSDCPSESQVKHYNQVESETQSEVLEGDTVHDDIEEPIRSNTDIGTEDLLTNENDSTSVVAVKNSNETDTDNVQVELQPILEIIEGNSINESIIAKIITEKVDQILKEKIEKQSETDTDGIRTTDIVTVENTSEITIDTTCETQVTNSSQPDSIDELPNTEITSEQIIANTDLVTKKKPIIDNTNIPPLIPVENNIEIDIDNIHKVEELSDCQSESQVKHYNQVESETQSEVLEGDIVHDDIEEPIRSNTDIRTEDLLTNENDSTSVVAFNNSNETNTDNIQVELQPILEIIEGNSINESIIAKIITEKVDQILKEKIEKQSETDTDGIRTTDIVPVENKSEITIDTTGETQVTNSSHPDSIDELPNTGITSEQIITNTDLVTNKRPIIDKTTIVSVMPVTNIPPLIPVENNIEIDIDNIHKVGESSDCPSESQVKHYNQVESETQSEVLEGDTVHDDIEEPIRSNTDIGTEDLLTNENDSTSVVAVKNSNETDTDNVQVELQPILEIIEGNSINESIIAKIITEKVDQILKEKIEKQSETDTDGIRTTDIVTVENTSEITIDTTCETQVTNSSQPDSIDELPNTEITSEQIIANTDLVTNKKPIIDNTNIPPLIPVENNIEIDIDNIHKVGELSDCQSESQVKHYNQVESETQSEVLEGDIVHDDIEEPIRSNTDIRTEDLLTNENDSTSVVAFNNSNETDTDNVQVELQPILEIIEGNSINESIIAKIITEKVDQILKEKIEKQSETDTDGIRTTDIVPVENKSEITIDTTGETQVTNSSHPDSIDELPNTGITSEQIITNTDLVTNKKPIIDKTTIVPVMPVTNIPPLIPVENNIEIDIDNIHKVGESSDCPSESQVKHYNQVESETQSEVLEGDTVHDDIEEPIRSNTDIGTEDLLTNENDSTSVVAVKNSNETDTDNVQVELQPILEIIEGNSINESIIAKIITEKVDQILKEKIEKQSETDTDGIRTTDIVTVENTSEITIDTTCETQVTNFSQPDSIDELPNTEITSEQIITNTDLVTNKKPIIDYTNIPPLIPVENNIEIDIDNIHKVGELSDCPSESQVKQYNQVESETQSEVLEGDTVHDDIEEPIRSNTDIGTEDLLTNENDSTSVVAFNNSNETDTDNVQVELQPILEIIEGNSINESIIAKIITEKVDQTLKEKIEKQSETDTDGIRTTDIVTVENTSEITIDTTCETQVTNSSQPDSIDELPNTGITSEQIITNTDLVTNKKPIIDKTNIASVMPVTNIPPLIPVENNIEIDIDSIHKVGESSDCPPESQVKHYNQVESETQSEVLEGDTVHDDIEEPIRSNTDIGTEDLLSKKYPFKQKENLFENAIGTTHETQVSMGSQLESVDEFKKTDMSFESNLHHHDTGVITIEEKENIDDNINTTKESSESNDAFSKPVNNTSNIDINIKHENLVLNDSPAVFVDKIQDVEIHKICGMEKLNILIPNIAETHISSDISILKEITQQKILISTDTKTDIFAEDISSNTNNLVPIPKMTEIDILEEPKHTETEIPIEIPLFNDALAVTVDNLSELDRVTTEELLLSTNSSLTCILSNTGSKSKNKLNDNIVTTEEIENSEVKNKNVQPTLFCDTVDTNNVDILNSFPKYRETSDDFQLSCDHNLRVKRLHGENKVKTCDNPEFELPVQDVETYATECFEETFVQSEQTEQISMSTVDNEKKTTIDDKSYTVNESDLNAILCASSLQEALTLLDSKIKFKFKNNTKKLSSKVKTATYDSSMQLPTSSNSEKNSNFTEARDFFKQIEQKSKNN